MKLKWVQRVWLTRLGLWNLFDFIRLLILSWFFRRPHEEDFQFFKNFKRNKSDHQPRSEDQSEKELSLKSRPPSAGSPDRVKDRGLFLDIGANVGQSAISFQIFNPDCNIFSFEPNPLLAEYLRFLSVLFKKSFSFRSVGIGEVEEVRSIYFPVVQGVPLTQEGSFFLEELTENSVVRRRIEETTGQKSFEIKKFEIQIIPLDSLKLNPDFIKLDVQGFELKALKGMTQTLIQSKPILMIENSSYMPEIVEFLAGLNYGHPLFYDSQKNHLSAIQDPGKHLNLFYVPKDKMPDLIKKKLCVV